MNELEPGPEPCPNRALFVPFWYQNERFLMNAKAPRRQKDPVWEDRAHRRYVSIMFGLLSIKNSGRLGGHWTDDLVQYMLISRYSARAQCGLGTWSGSRWRFFLRPYMVLGLNQLMHRQFTVGAGISMDN